LNIKKSKRGTMSIIVNMLWHESCLLTCCM